MGKEYDKVISFNSLYSGLRRSRRGVMWKDSVASYSLNGMESTYKLRRSILQGKYHILPYNRFTIREPKVRDVLATRIRDRQFQASLCDNSVYHRCTSSFIRNNCACQKKRGVDDAHVQFKRILQDHYRRIGKQVRGYALKCDIKGFFPNTPHISAQQAMCRQLPDREVAAAVCEIIESFAAPKIEDRLIELGADKKRARNLAYSITYIRMQIVRQKVLHPDCTIDTAAAFAEAKVRIAKSRIVPDDKVDGFANWALFELMTGIGLGSECSQLTELTLLNGLDHYIKERLRIKCYIRYMDDFVLLHESKEVLRVCWDEIKHYVESLGLTLNAKTEIIPVKRGIYFLNWKFLITKTGGIAMRMSRKSITREKHRIAGQKRLLDKDELTMTTIEDSFRSWRANAARGDTKSVIYKMERLYKETFGKEPPPWKKLSKNRALP